MKVVVFGGAGDMGSRAVEDLAAQKDVHSVTIADQDEAKAAKVAAMAGSEKVRVLRVDANSPGSLQQAMAGHQVAASALGPFYRFERPLAQAALQAGVDYVSICDDYDALQSIRELDSEAKAKNVALLSGVGWTPGISNLLAARGVLQLDRAEEVKVYWAGSASDSKGLAVILHTMHIFTGQVPTFRGGKEAMVRAGSEKERIRFPAPVGEVNTYHVGHPEPLTISRAFPQLKMVSLKGGLAESYLNQLAKAMSAMGLTRSHRQKVFLARILQKTLPAADRLMKGIACSGIKVVVIGEKEGRPREISLEAAAPMRELTGLPLSIAALMLGRGQIKARGVLAPEDCLDHELFFTELNKRGISVSQK